MGRQRPLTVYDNIEVASAVRDGDSSAEQQDVVAVDPVQKLTRAEPQQLMILDGTKSNCDVPLLVLLAH